MNLFYIQTVTGGTEPELHGPYPTAQDRDDAARRFHAEQDPDTDAVFALDLTLHHSGLPVVETWAYTGAFFGDDD